MLDGEHALLPSLKGPEYLDVWNLSTKTILCKDIGWQGENTGISDTLIVIIIRVCYVCKNICKKQRINSTSCL